MDMRKMIKNEKNDEEMKRENGNEKKMIKKMKRENGHEKR